MEFFLPNINKNKSPSEDLLNFSFKFELQDASKINIQVVNTDRKNQSPGAFQLKTTITSD